MLVDKLLPHFSDHKSSYKKVYDQTSVALAEEPENVKALFERGLACQALRWYPQALDDFSEVVRLRPSQAKGWMLLAEVLEVLGRFEESRAARQQSHELDPTSGLPFNADAVEQPLTKSSPGVEEQV
jgi:Flp pilus assembly protein TadD